MYPLQKREGSPPSPTLPLVISKKVVIVLAELDARGFVRQGKERGRRGPRKAVGERQRGVAVETAAVDCLVRKEVPEVILDILPSQRDTARIAKVDAR